MPIFFKHDKIFDFLQIFTVESSGNDGSDHRQQRRKAKRFEKIRPSVQQERRRGHAFRSNRQKLPSIPRIRPGRLRENHRRW